MIWLVEARFEGKGTWDSIEPAPTSRATMLNANGEEGVWFRFRSAIEADAKDEAVAEAIPMLGFLARRYGLKQLVELKATEYETKEALAEALT